MTNHAYMTRRQMIGTVMAGAMVQGCKSLSPLCAKPIVGDPRVRGPFPILSTPFTTSGTVDYDVLARQAQFVDWCGSPGMIWPQSGDSVDLLTTEEKLRGMEVLSEVTRGRRSALCLGVQGKDTEEMLVFAKHVEKLAPAAIISRPPDSGKTENDLRHYWHALAGVARRPVIIQTSGGVAYKGPAPSVKLLIELARESPYFGYVKEETNPIVPRMKELVAAKPTIKTVFSAMGGFGWLYQAARRLGGADHRTCGLCGRSGPHLGVDAKRFRSCRATRHIQQIPADAESSRDDFRQPVARVSPVCLEKTRRVQEHAFARIRAEKQRSAEAGRVGAGTFPGGHCRDRKPVRGAEAIPKAGFSVWMRVLHMGNVFL